MAWECALATTAYLTLLGHIGANSQRQQTMALGVAAKSPDRTRMTSS